MHPTAVKTIRKKEHAKQRQTLPKYQASIVGSASFGRVVGFSGTGIQGTSSRMYLYHSGAMADLSSLIDRSNGTWKITMIAGGRHDGQLTFNILLTPIQ